MKTIAQIRDIIEAEKRRDGDDVLNWLEDVVIPQQIYGGMLSLCSGDRRLSKYFEYIKPILEQAGYKVERVKESYTEFRLFGKNKKHIINKIKISWE